MTYQARRIINGVSMTSSSQHLMLHVATLQRCVGKCFDITVAPKEHQKTDACGLMAELAQDRVQSSS